MVQRNSTQQAKPKGTYKQQNPLINNLSVAGRTRISQAQPNNRPDDEPKDCGAPREEKSEKGPSLPLIQGGFAELNTDTRY